MTYPYQFTFSEVLAFAESDPLASGTLQPGSFRRPAPDPARELRDARELGALHARAGYPPDCEESEYSDPLAAAYLDGYRSEAGREAA